MAKHTPPPWLKPRTPPTQVKVGVTWYAKEEWAKYAPLFTDRPDDSPESRTSKAANRASLTGGMRVQAGRAWSDELEHLADEAAKTTLEGFKPKKAAGARQPAAPADKYEARADEYMARRRGARP